MVQGPPPPPETPPYGAARLWIRSALAPPLWSRWWIAGALGIAAVAAAEIAFTAHPAVGSAFAVVALVAGLAGARGDAIVIATCCVAATAVSGVWSGWDVGWTITLVVVAASSVTAVLVSLLRAVAVTTGRQLELLDRLGTHANSSRGVRELAGTLLDLLVPAYADAAMLDLAIQDYDRRVAARVAGPHGSAAEEWLRGRPPVGPSLPGTQQVIATGRPALVEEVDAALLARLASDEADLVRLRGLAPRSALTLPLATRGAPFGAVTLIVGASGRRYTRADLAFAQLVQGRMATVLDNTSLSRAAMRSEAIMVAALDNLQEAVTMNGPDGATVYANQAAVRLLKAQSADELYNARPGQIAARFAIFDEAGDPLPYRELPAFRAIAGEQDPGPRLVRNVVRATGEERWLLNKVSVLRDGDGNVDRIVNVIEDVTQVKQAEVRERLLGEATRLLSGSGDRERTLARLAGVVVPELAAWCEIRARDQERETIARAGRDTAVGDEHLTVPVVAAGTELATIALGRTHRFAAEEVRMVEELGHRAGIALLNMRLSEEQAEITRELQDGLRPPALPAIPGVQTATLYRPAGELNDVGGDFYDAFPTATDWTVVIGDVAGQGARAAALTGLTRFTLRSVAQYAGAQHDAMAAVNRALVEQSDMALCTLAVLRLSRGDDGGVTLGALSAGHPLPVLLRDGQASELGVPGPIAGVFDDAAWDTATVALRDGDTLVLYTDGVLDTVGSDGRFGPERLLEVLCGVPADPQTVVERVAAALAAYQSGPQRDDTAIVALTVRDATALAAAIGRAHATA
jgi:serine phosphatase RsbU (regulator of sigma subunit)/PAS domain-containing protein